MQIRFLTLVLALLCATGCAQLPARTAWVQQNGGIDATSCLPRAQAAARLLDPRVQAYVLASNELAAYSFPDGSIYLTHGLVQAATDNELAAAVAHELGHLLRDGRLQTLVALEGTNTSRDVETRADLVGCQLLKQHHIPPQAMIALLRKVSKGLEGQKLYTDLSVRIAAIQSTIK